MEFRRLRFFLTLADELHFRRAAARCGVTPSVLSEQLRRLEDELGGPLFLRTTRVVQLTPLGVSFRQEAQAALNRLEQAKLAAQRFASGSARTVRIGLTTSFAYSPAVTAFAHFRDSHPETELFVQELGTVDIESALARYEIDVGLLHPPIDHSELIFEDLGVEPLDAVHGAAIELRGRPHLSDVLAQPLIWHPHRRAPRLSADLFAKAQASGCVPNIVAEAESWHAARVLAAAGVGVALLPRPLAMLENAALRKAIVGQPLAIKCAAATRSSDGDDYLLGQFINCVAQTMKRVGLG